MTHAEWLAEGERRFGKAIDAWRFVCPVCKVETTAKEWKDAGAPEGAIGFSCVGRWTASRDALNGKGPGPCNYTGGGLFALNPVTVVFPDGEKMKAFDFAPVAEQPTRGVA